MLSVKLCKIYRFVKKYGCQGTLMTGDFFIVCIENLNNLDDAVAAK